MSAVTITKSTFQHRNSKSLFDFSKEEIRLASFSNYPSTTENLNYELLARTGFYFTGIVDEILCYFCSLRFDHAWKTEKEIIQMHYKYSKNCPLLHRRPTNNCAKDEIELDLVLPPLIYDECGSGFRSGKAQLTRKLSFPEYSTYNARLDTYMYWPKAMKQRPEALAEAGLFYTEEGDKVVCFECKIGLKDWEPNDLPWIEHAKWSKNCYYVLFMKGQDFIDNVKNRKFPKLETDASTYTANNSIHIEENCRICKNRRSEVVMLPCYHGSYCKNCAVEIEECVVCKAPIDCKLRLYYA
jgi:baculoviral IAP repeat-containing protein 7/8